jgi:hypothetical protein
MVRRLSGHRLSSTILRAGICLRGRVLFIHETRLLFLTPWVLKSLCLLIRFLPGVLLAKSFLHCNCPALLMDPFSRGMASVQVRLPFGRSVLTKAPPPRESLRSVSGPMPPVGENWRAPPAQRSVSLGMKNPPTQEAWNAGSGWTSSWNSSNRTQPRQQPDLGPGLVDPWVPLDVLPFPSQAKLAYSLSRAGTWTSRATIYHFRTT